MQHLAKIYLKGISTSPITEARFTAPPGISELDLLILAGKAIDDRIYLEVTQDSITQNSVKNTGE